MMLIFSFWFDLTEGWQIALVTMLLSIVLWVVKIIFKPNHDFFKLLYEFQKELPPSQKRAKEKNGVIEYFTVLDTTNMKMNIDTHYIDLFQKKLEIFNYNRIIFNRKEIKAYSENIQRIIRTSPWEKFGIAVIQSILEDEENKSKKPYLFGERIGRIIGL